MHMRGFTLIELMVSVAIFSIVMTISLGALLSISAADRKAETISSVMNNLNFAIESMTRNIRTGYDYHCIDNSSYDCGVGGSPGGTYFKFTSQSGVQTVYKYSTDANDCAQPTAPQGCILRSTDNGSTFVPITAPEVVVTNLTFYLRGSYHATPDVVGDPSDLLQPNVVITATGYVKISTTQNSAFNIQTSITQRLYDR